MREDVIRVMLQIKLLRMKMFDVDTARLHLEVRGSGEVTAADIIAPPEVEIADRGIEAVSIGHRVEQRIVQALSDVVQDPRHSR